ncbi:MAG: carbon-phosphorus lyase complex subunit PhnI [Alphaproteobacteria bacterium]
MAYVAAKGGEDAIARAHAWLEAERRGDVRIPALTVAQIREQMGRAVDRVLAEGSCYDRDLAALALKQAMGDVQEAVFLLRAYRTTLPRFGASHPMETGAMAVRRRVSAAFKDLPGGQILGPTPDYSHRLLDFALAAEADGHPPPQAAEADAPVPPRLPTIGDALAGEDLLDTDRPSEAGPAPYDITREPLRVPAGRDQRLQTLARGDEGFLLGLAYSTQRGFGATHPLCGEIRMGDVAIAFQPEDLGFAIHIADLTVTECQMLSTAEDRRDTPPRFARGYGLVFGHNERKAMSMALVDRALSNRDGAADPGNRTEIAPAEDEEFVLYHCDSLSASGFVQHLKLPHYVDFQADLQVVRRRRAAWEARQQGSVSPTPQTSVPVSEESVLERPEPEEPGR